MPTKIVLGAQWGDEGKAKVVDYLTHAADIVVRFQGGANAGHTVQVGDTQFIFHLVPSGIMHPDKTCVVGNGVVLDPEGALDEIDELAEKGISCDGRLFISQNAHLVMPYHKIFDRAGEERQGSSKLGTTGRGIGPCYRDKVERSYGVRVMDLLDPDGLRAKLEKTVAVKNELLTKIYGEEPLEVDGMVDTFIAFGERLKPLVADTSLLLNQAIDSGKQILCSISITAPIRSSPPPIPRPEVPAPAPASGRRASTK